MDERIKEIEEYLKQPDFLTRQKNGLLLNKRQIDILDRFNVPWQNCTTFTSLVYEIDEILLEIDDEELEKLASELQEFSYYNEVNK